jgi:osmotically-inducible protein OsmY
MRILNQQRLWCVSAALMLSGAPGCKRDDVAHSAKQQPAGNPVADESATAKALVKSRDSNRPPSDGDITRAVSQQLSKDPGVDESAIHVTTTKGVVHLTGTVGDLLSKERAARIAENIRGVRSVSDRVGVELKPRKDAQIRNELRNMLLYNGTTDSFEIDTGVEEGRVTLKGKVDSWAEKQLAERVAKAVRGVKQVDNQLEVHYAAERTDAEIQRDVESRLRWDALVNGELIDVKVDADGRVRLSGQVGSPAERWRAHADAWVVGVRAVDTSGIEVTAAAADMVRDRRWVSKPDAEVARAIEDAAFYDPRVSSFKIDAEVAQGKATLRGTVSSLNAKLAAESIARHTVGVRDVSNRIVVATKAPLPDKAIGDRVRAALFANPITEAYEIKTEVADGTVRLIGGVDTNYERAMAADVAASIDGVKKVENKLELEKPTTRYMYSAYLDPFGPLVETWTYLPPTATRPDAEIEQEIEAELLWSPFVDADDVNVSVERGKATLTGTVNSWKERFAATENALEGGAIAVYNQLRVE